MTFSVTDVRIASRLVERGKDKTVRKTTSLQLPFGTVIAKVLNVAGEVTRRRLRKHKPGLQSGPVFLLVSGLGFGLGQSCIA